MRSLRLKFGLAVLIGVSLAAPVQQLSAGEEPERAQARSLTAFIDVHVIPMDSERVLDHQTVQVLDGKIVAMGPAKDAHVPHDAQRIAAADKWLLPGLADMHVHVNVDDDLALFVANGVTTVLHMGLAPSYVVNLDNRAIDSGKLVGPRIFFGFMIDGNGEGGRPYVTTPQQARAIVQFAKTNGYDFVKVYNSISQAEFTAIVDEAHLLNMAVIGHGVRVVGLPQGLRQGEVMVAHAEEFLYTAFADKTDYAAIPEVAAATRDDKGRKTRTPATAPAGSNRSSYGGDEVAEAFGEARHDIR